MTHKMIRAEELAKLAGVHKSTVLLAIRRNELRVSRTGGHNARIFAEEARKYLQSRDRPIPPELEPAGAPPVVAVVTESLEVAASIRRVMPGGAKFLGGNGVYGSLIEAGASVPAALVIDLDITILNPFGVIRSLRDAEQFKDTLIFAVGLRSEAFSAALSAGAQIAFRKVEMEALMQALQRCLGFSEELMR